MPDYQMMPGAPTPAVTGFFGKLPARGDFVRAGLPSSFVAIWDAWVSGMLAGSREILGPEWLPAWLEAPVWRFALPEGLCGPSAAAGLFMPSVDNSRRFFPLCFARLVPRAEPPALAAASAGFLVAAEAAGRAALEHDLSPELVLAHLASADGNPPDLRLPRSLDGAPVGRGLWWTDGSPRVAPGGFALGALPGPRRFAAMLDESFAAAESRVDP